MKCSAIQCNNYATTMEVQGRYYCSEPCAHYDIIHHRNGTESVRTEKSSSQEHGERSPVCSRDVNTTTPETKGVERKQDEVHTIPTSIEHEKEREKDTFDNFPKTLNGSGEKTGNESKDLILVSSSPSQLVSSKGETLGSMSLIDESIVQTHSLMKSAAEQIRDQAKNKKIDSQLLNSTINRSKQTASLLKLKLEYHNAMKGTK